MSNSEGIYSEISITIPVLYFCDIHRQNSVKKLSVKRLVLAMISLALSRVFGITNTSDVFI